jgi:hypothetical protein
MTEEQRQTIEAAVDEAIEALPNGDDQQLTAWVMAHRYPSFTSDIRDALRDAGLEHLIRVEARKLGVTLQE